MNSSTENLWHYSDGSTNYGPFAASVIRQLQSAGVISDGTNLRHHTEDQWTPLSQVDLDAERPKPVPVVAPPLSPATDEAAYHLSRNGQVSGPFPASEIKALLSRREASSSDLVWQEGMTEWTAVSNIPQLRPNSLMPPPPPPPPSTQVQNAQVASGERNAFQLYFADVLKTKTATFKGRASRKEYWMFVLFFILLDIGLAIVDALIPVPVLSMLFELAMFIPLVAALVRRLQDTNNSGWWVFLPIGNIVFAMLPGTPGPNKYGPPTSPSA